MSAWDNFVKRVRQLRRQGCNKNQMVSQLRAEYPSIASSTAEALKKIQKADRDNRNLNDW